ncbi:MAG: DUF2330 domain-containing protein [Polyangiaceae bacterium]|nr:DUF2330 domain-containing protein [Polyangiaceae bacterium]
MRLGIVSLILLVSGTVTVLCERDAHACGGCFVSQSESTQVTGHRMALSVSPTQTTLWDQITYDGDPSEFAWVLPIRQEVQIGLSSDLLFEVLESETQVVIQSPNISCPPSGCGAFGTGSAATAGAGPGGGVEVIAQAVVGPYETVQLSATDPAALATWLDDHGYNVPAEVQPVVDAYVEEGFGFLALRLVPGQGVDAMKPVRITVPGASPTLPLRMVAAGTGARTAITLWVLGEGRYNPQNFGYETIEGSQLVWDWNSQSSNYQSIRQEILDADGGSRWLIESAEPLPRWSLDQLVQRASYDPVGSGYADDMGNGAVEAAEEDVATIVAGLDQGSLFLTRMSADLARSALATDLFMSAASPNDTVSRFLSVANTVGNAPSCPPPPVCGDDENGSTYVDLNGDGVYSYVDWGNDEGDRDRCGFAPAPKRAGIAWVGLLGAAYVLGRRRWRRR